MDSGFLDFFTSALCNPCWMSASLILLSCVEKAAITIEFCYLEAVTPILMNFSSERGNLNDNPRGMAMRLQLSLPPSQSIAQGSDKGNRAAANGMSLTYITPTLIDGMMVATLDKTEIENENSKWRCALIVYILGEVPGFKQIERYIAMNWQNVATPELYLHEEGYYMVKFKSMDDLNEILLAGPYSFNSRPMILKQWEPKLDFSTAFLTDIPLWVKLPVNCWSPDSLSRIGNTIGNPLFADECTINQSRVSFARMLIEVNVTKPLPDMISVMEPDGVRFDQQITYDWKPTYCTKCLSIGHQCREEVREPPKARGQPRRRRRQQQSAQAWVNKAGENDQIAKDTGIGNGPIGEAEGTVVDPQRNSPPHQGQQHLIGQQSQKNGLVETRIKEEKATGICARIASTWSLIHNYNYAPNGRVWLIWDDTVFKVTPLVSDAQFIHCQVSNRRSGDSCLMTVIYAFNTIEQRKSLWQELYTLGQLITIPWLIWGDFNAIMCAQDRLYSAPVTSSEVKDFNKCVQQPILTELPWMGEYYTWSNKQRGDARVWSRLDRALGNEEWMLHYRYLVTEYKLPHISDHSPMLLPLKTEVRNIKVPFKFLNVWAEHPSFLQIVENKWKRQSRRSKMRDIWQNLKALRSPLRTLNYTEFRSITEKIELARSKLNDIQKDLVQQYSDQLADKEFRLTQQLEYWSLIEEKVLQQKSRISWIKLGDASNKYFSAVMKERKHRKQINELTAITGAQLTDPGAIQEEIIQVYKNLMGSSAYALPAVNRNIMRKGPIKKCTIAYVELVMINLREWMDIILIFFKKAWSIIGKQITEAVLDYFDAGQLYKGINCTAITLVPKVPNPSTIKDYRPIACCTVLYKIIAKVLAARLQKVLPSIISEAQSGFVPGRKISDNVILANELVKSYARKHISPRCMIKVDMQKAYDSVEWPYLEQVMKGLGFPTKFRDWIFGRVKTVNYSIVINGESTKPFNAAKRLRQGDPISPFLFAIDMEYLSRNLNELKEDKQFKYHPRCGKLGITHLSFADDLLLFTRGDHKSVRMCSPKTAGGLNLPNLKLWNKAAVAKNCWDLAKKEDKMWIKWVHVYYMKGQTLDEMNIPTQASWMVQNRLMTVDRLLKWGISVDPLCVLCAVENENRDHLFLHCIFTQNLWRRLKRWLRLNWPDRGNWELHMKEVLTRTKGKTTQASLLRMVYTEYVNAVWRERNMRVFEKRQQTEETIARDIACTCNIRATPAEVYHLFPGSGIGLESRQYIAKAACVELAQFCNVILGNE
ncbi:uncharacterized protein LOC132061833 [Lycium ferocissimum]|uniref:uncharacterized protein LOC132061833 n=1 Tax=Lycium ferocissimum TaxID=112874 RepID=UPI002814B2AB|nr:uncharacterized protein LOC132061833 [Lycium ferocissimum]